MSNLYTTDTLVKTIKRRGTIPSSQQLLTEEEFVNIANDEMETLIVPRIMKVMNNYFMGAIDINPNGKNYVEMPADAVGQKAHNVSLVDQNGQVTSLTMFSIKSAEEADSLISTGFYVMGNRVYIKCNDLQNYSVRVHYPKRPLTLTPMTKAGKITTVNTGTKELNVGNVAASWSIGQKVNIIKGNQPFDTILEATIVSISSPTIELDSVDGVEVNDYIALQGFSPIPQIPVEAHKVLAQAAVVKVLEAMGDREGMGAAERKLQQNLEDMITTITPRVDLQPKKIVSNGISGALGVNSRRRF